MADYHLHVLSGDRRRRNRVHPAGVLVDLYVLCSRESTAAAADVYFQTVGGLVTSDGVGRASAGDVHWSSRHFSVDSGGDALDSRRGRYSLLRDELEREYLFGDDCVP